MLIEMDLQSRKIEFVQEFLKLRSEEAISRLEKLLKKEKKNVIGKEFKPMTEQELIKRIDQSESDFKDNRFKKSSELLSKYE
jgi:hypothetical protein